MRAFKELTERISYPAVEREILAYWKEHRIFEQSISSREGKPGFTFYEGPPTANGRPGIHHVMSRTLKDLACRYQTMRGKQVHRKAGWDTHGLPVEIEVEKELGFKHKEDIVRYGVAEFNKKCRESVWKYKADWETDDGADGLLGGPHPPVRHLRERLHRIHLVGAQALLR